MDIVAHGLITATAAIFAQRKLNRRIHVGWAVLFGVLPDLATFTVPAVWWRVTGVTKTLLPQPDGPHFEWAFGLYNCSHSLLIFGLLFGAVWAIRRRPLLEALGWMLHIVIDIFTHRGWFAIQFLWPVSAARLDGIPWETPWVLAATYVTLMLALFALWRTRVTTPGKRTPCRQSAPYPLR